VDERSNGEIHDTVHAAAAASSMTLKIRPRPGRTDRPTRLLILGTGSAGFEDPLVAAIGQASGGGSSDSSWKVVDPGEAPRDPTGLPGCSDSTPGCRSCGRPAAPDLDVPMHDDPADAELA
jgi:hypothetical protein